MIYKSNVFIINNPDPDPKLRLMPDLNPDLKKKKFGSTTLSVDYIGDSQSQL
jgi:hypothetical protein